MRQSIKVRDFAESDESALVSLWNACGLTRPWNDPALDIQRKICAQPDWLLVGMLNDEIVASAMVGYDGHRGWINYLAVHPSHRQSGVGRLLMSEAEARLRGVGCPKINLQVRRDNLEATAFYEAIGFTQDDVVSFGKRLTDDSIQQNEHESKP
ncbi:MAG: GNAT family acetyltransferase [Rubripirellula sp.]